MNNADFAGSKLAVLYFVYALDMPLTNVHLAEFFTGDNILNYFDLQQLLVELCDTEHVQLSEYQSSQYYTLTDKGREAITLFKNKIHLKILSLIDDYAHENRARLKNESQLTADYEKLADDNYEVSLKVLELDHTVMEIKLYVPTIAQARAITGLWNKKALKTYQTIIETFTQ